MDTAVMIQEFIFECIAVNGVHVRNVSVFATNYWSAKRKAEMEAPGYKEYRAIY